MARTQFVVNHYAGGVTYTIDDMVEKNKDKIEEDVAKLMTTATLGEDFVSHQLYASVQKEMAAKAKGGSSIDKERKKKKNRKSRRTEKNRHKNDIE